MSDIKLPKWLEDSMDNLVEDEFIKNINPILKELGKGMIEGWNKLSEIDIDFSKSCLVIWFYDVVDIYGTADCIEVPLSIFQHKNPIEAAKFDYISRKIAENEKSLEQAKRAVELYQKKLDELLPQLEKAFHGATR